MDMSFIEKQGCDFLKLLSYVSFLLLMNLFGMFQSPLTHHAKKVKKCRLAHHMAKKIDIDLLKYF